MVVDVGLGTPALRVERVGLAQREEGVSSGLAWRVLADEAVGVDSERMALPIEALSLQRGLGIGLGWLRGSVEVRGRVGVREGAGGAGLALTLTLNP